VIPLSFLRRLDSLKYTSVVALVSIGYLVILVVYHFSKGDTKADRGPIRIIQWAGVVPALSSFPVIVFAYTCHQNVGSPMFTWIIPQRDHAISIRSPY
jgi:amino acid permease